MLKSLGMAVCCLLCLCRSKDKEKRNPSGILLHPLQRFYLQECVGAGLAFSKRRASGIYHSSNGTTVM
jgi:hypothetical protein